jgi:hypothetical protein
MVQRTNRRVNVLRLEFVRLMWHVVATLALTSVLRLANIAAYGREAKGWLARRFVPVSIGGSVCGPLGLEGWDYGEADNHSRYRGVLCRRTSTFQKWRPVSIAHWPIEHHQWRFTVCRSEQF